MPSLLAPLLWLHLGAAAALLVLALLRLARPEAPRAARACDSAAALLAASVLPLAGAGGWWADMSVSKMVPLITALALALAAFGAHRAQGRLAALALAAFFVTLGLVSLRHGGPLPGVLSGKAVLLGLMLALLPLPGAVRLRMLLLIVLLAAVTGLALLGTIPAA
jgi:hypothetical protein